MKLSKLLQNIDIDISEEELNDRNSFEELRDYLEESGYFDKEVVYYSNAIKYLKENDPSLTESLEIASELGYSLDDLNSEVLASLLRSRKTRLDFEGLKDEIEEFYENK